MNVEDVGTPIFKIQKKLDTGKIKTVDTVYSGETADAFNEIKLKKGEYTQIIPSNKERDILYISGQSGSGKSYFSLHFLKEYHLKHPKNPIYLFSSLIEDKTLDKFKTLKRVKLDENFLKTEFVITDFQDCCVIFDDTDALQDRFFKVKIQNILNMLLQTGRHTRTSVIYTSHLPACGNQTKMILNEANSITFFCNGLGARALKYLLETHLGLDKLQRKKIKALNSRATSFLKTFPNIILYDKGAYKLTDLDC